MHPKDANTVVPDRTVWAVWSGSYTAQTYLVYTALTCLFKNSGSLYGTIEFEVNWDMWDEISFKAWIFP